MDVNEFFAVGDTITFSTIQPSVLGATFTRVKVLAVLDAETAKLFIDPIALHAAVYPAMDSPNNVTYKKYTDYLYIKIRLQNGNETVLGLPWIIMDSNMKVTTLTGRFTVALNNPEDINTITAILKANGFYNVIIEEL